MFSQYLTIGAALLAVATAAPITKRDSCTEGMFNCIDGTHYAQCISGGVWSVTMATAPGTTCAVGISANPWLPADGSSSGSTAPAASSSAQSQPSTTAATIPTTTDSPPPPPESTTTDSSPPATTTASSPVTTAPSGSTDCGGFTCISGWESWSNMRAKYEPYMGTSLQCPSSWGAPNTAQETSEVLDAIESLSGSVDPRFVLAIMMQESRGCVRVITTSNSVQNPGLLQDFNGSHSCNGLAGDCPVSEIDGMIADGVSGGDDNLSKNLVTATNAGYKDAFAYAVAARIYNSGSFDPNNLNNGFSATSAYVKQVMARLPAGAPVS